MLKNLYKIEKVFLALLILFFCVVNFALAQSSVESDITITATVPGPDTGGGGGGGSITVGAPVATPGSGTYTSTQFVTLTSASSTSIHYTTDGTSPSCSSGITYSSAITVSSTETVKAIGCNGIYFSSISISN